MKTLQRMLLITVVAMTAASLAGAIEPAHVGKYGNPEEPATRPYKAVWRGLKTLFGGAKHRDQDAATNNRGDTPKQRRAFRQFGYTMYMGMAGTYTPPAKKVDKPVSTMAEKPKAVAEPAPSASPAETTSGAKAPVGTKTGAPTAGQHLEENPYSGDMIKKARKGRIAP
jgi:hypothetical protein